MLLAVWIVPRWDDQADIGCELEALGSRGHHTQRDERVHYIEILLCQRGLALRVGKSALGRPVRMLGHPQRVEKPRSSWAAPSAAGEIEYSVKKIEAPMSMALAPPQAGVSSPAISAATARPRTAASRAISAHRPV